MQVHEIQSGQIVRYTDHRGRQYDGAIVEEVDRDTGDVLVQVSPTRLVWVFHPEQLSIPR